MEIRILENEAAFDRAAAWQLVGCMVNRPEAAIGLATGATTRGVYRAAADIYAAHPFDTSAVRLFGLDEIVGVPQDFTGSCLEDIWLQLAGPLNVPKAHIVMPDGQAADLPAEAARYGARVAALGRPELVVLGLGRDGHLGMNLPGTPFEQDTWYTPLSGELDARVRAPNHLPESHVIGGITLGIRTIMRMPRLLLLVKGAEKAGMVRKALQGPVTPQVPASVLQLHPAVTVMLESAAAGALSEEISRCGLPAIFSGQRDLSFSVP
ncbi:6-phosphogluconolactonase [Ruminococcaceae bacterium OttesenSCG-928-D13]|nr:6-phosphogluconolactonase [Ruminococcaceae bacterium OttesenSCG-928-D13]